MAAVFELKDLCEIGNAVSSHTEPAMTIFDLEGPVATVDLQQVLLRAILRGSGYRVKKYSVVESNSNKKFHFLILTDMPWSKYREIAAAFSHDIHVQSCVDVFDEE